MKTSHQLEHRWSPRRPVTLDVTLYPRGAKALKGTIQDVSIGGMFVETDTRAPAVNTTVAVSFRLGTDGESNYYRMSAIVIRSKANGAGLMFEDYDEGTVSSLRRMYHQALSSPRAHG